MIKRRQFIAGLGSAAACPMVVRAQQPAVPVIGFLRSTPLPPLQSLVTAFGQGLKEAGFVEGQNVAIEYRYADNQVDRLPTLVAELIRLRAAVIVVNRRGDRALRPGLDHHESPVQSGLRVRVAGDLHSPRERSHCSCARPGRKVVTAIATCFRSIRQP
jgi:hypothetical protein